MGAGRKTHTMDVDTKAASAAHMQSFQERQRNLAQNLGGAIFGCTNDTMEECLVDMVFGLPRAHWCYVQWISEGMPIFLFNYVTRKLHGIFQAESDGEFEIKPEGWCKGSGTKTFYPSQVRVKLIKDCEPLLEREYKAILPNNISDDGQLLFELKSSDAQNLIRAFEEKTSRYGKRGTEVGQMASRATPFRPASPPAIPAWGAAAAKKKEQQVPRMSDFPSLSGTEPEESVMAESERGSNAGPPSESGASVDRDLSKMSLSSPAPPPRTAARPEPTPSYPITRPSSAAPGGLAAAVGAERSRPQSRGASASGTSTPKELPSSITPKEVQGGSNWSQVSTAPPILQPPAQDTLAGSLPPANGFVPHSHPPPPAATVSNGPLAAVLTPAEEFMRLSERAQNALWGVGPDARDAFCQLFAHIGARLEREAADRYSLATVAARFKMEKDALEEVVGQQSQLINLLREESIALRRDLAYIGDRINIRVAPTNIALLSNEPAPQLHAAQQLPPTCSEPLAEPQVVPTTPEQLLLLGGHDLTAWLDTVDVFVPRKRRWQTRSRRMPCTYGYGDAAVIGRHVYLVGGGAGRQCSDDCIRYDVHSEEWCQMAGMREVRGSLAAAALGGYVYALGGGRRDEQLQSMEVLDPNANAWIKGEDMHAKRFGVAACVMANCIVANGGYDGTQYLGSTERYDPREGIWHPMPALAEGRGGHQLLATGSEIWALGGYDGRAFLNSVEVLETRTGSWRTLAPMQQARAYFGAEALDGVVYTIGGMASASELNLLVELYDRSTGTWQEVPLQPGTDDSTHKRAFVAACKVDVL